MTIAALSSCLTRNPEGIWVGPASGLLSYPESGQQECLQVGDRSFWFEHRNACILSAFRRHPPPGPVLDVGGGNGFVTHGLLEKGFEAVLLEPGPVGAFNARTRRGIPEVICSTLGGAGLPEGCLAGVGCFNVIEHVDDDGAGLAGGAGWKGAGA